MNRVDAGFGRTRISRTPTAFPAGRCAGLSLIEILVVLAVLATLTATCAIGLKSKVQQAHAARCSSNLRQLGLAALSYAADNNMCLPVSSHQRASGGKSWTQTLKDYAGGNVVFRCPTDEAARTYTYVLNEYLTPNPSGAEDLNYSRLSRLERPSLTFLFAEAASTYTGADHVHFTPYRGLSLPPEIFAYQIATQRHNGAANYFFADGHLETLAWKTVKTLLGNPRSGLVEPWTSNP